MGLYNKGIIVTEIGKSWRTGFAKMQNCRLELMKVLSPIQISTEQ